MPPKRKVSAATQPDVVDLKDDEAFVHDLAATVHGTASGVQGTLDLLALGSTVPFIARYRKERTGGLAADAIRTIAQKAEGTRTLHEKRRQVVGHLYEASLMTPALKAKLERAKTIAELEDIYAPYRPKRRTLANDALEKGLGPLAHQVFAWICRRSHKQITRPLLDRRLDGRVRGSCGTLPSRKEAERGLVAIIAECMAGETGVRQSLRTTFRRMAEIHCRRKGVRDKAKGEAAKEWVETFHVYLDFSRPVRNLLPHQVLAINRGEDLNVLSVKLTVPSGTVARIINDALHPRPLGDLHSIWEAAVQDASKRLLEPAVSRDIRREITQQAEAHAINVFGKNLLRLLMTPPIRDRRIVGIDPGLRTGCKLAAIDEQGTVLGTSIIHPLQGTGTATRKLQAFCHTHRADLIVIGDGTGMPNALQCAAGVRQCNGTNIEFTVVSEAGASVYSASKEAEQELPHLDISLRGAVSIARRVQDALSEFVKIDPKSLGVGMYQHDIPQKDVQKEADDILLLAVSFIGVDLNVASAELLRHVSGLNRALAQKIVQRRQEVGPFRTRAELLHIQGVGPLRFQQAAGFLMIPNSENPLDGTLIHPESYDATLQLLKHLGLEAPDRTLSPSFRATMHERIKDQDLSILSCTIGIGEDTLKGIVDALVQPPCDIREDLPRPCLRTTLLSLQDVRVGMKMEGTIRNVCDFGAFVDVGLAVNGLLHVSKIPGAQNRRYAESVYDLVAVNDIVRVKVVGVEADRGRFALSMRDDDDDGDDDV